MAAASAVLCASPSIGGAVRDAALAQLRAENADLAAKTRSAVLDLYALDARLGSARSQLGRLDGAQRRLEAERGSIERQLQLASLDSRLSEDRVAIRLRYLYDYSDGTSSLDVLLGSNSIDQVLTRIDDVNEVAAANQSVIVQLRSAQRRLSLLSLELGLRERALSETVRAREATVSELGQAQAQRSSYLAGLQSRSAYTSRRIVELNAEAQAAVARSQQLARERAAATAVAAKAAAAARSAALRRSGRYAAKRAPSNAVVVVAPSLAAPSDGQPAGLAAVDQTASQTTVAARRTITVIATGYDLPGSTSTGLPVGYGVAAVDPSVIPLGTRMNIPGYGEAVAADTGGSIVGARIDLWFPTTGQADAWGRRTVTIVVGS